MQKTFFQLANKINEIHEKVTTTAYELTRADFRVLADWHLLMVMLYTSEWLFQVAGELGLVIYEPDRRRGVYVGRLVDQDQQAGVGLVQYAREKAVFLPLEALAEGQAKPNIGDLVRMDFRTGALVVTFRESATHSFTETQQ